MVSWTDMIHGLTINGLHLRLGNFFKRVGEGIQSQMI